MMIGWSGPELLVLERLARAGADRGDDGRFIVSGDRVRYTLKDKVLYVAVPVGAVFFVRGQRRSFATILEGVPSINPLLDKAANVYGPLSPENRQAVMDYIDAPTEEGWERIYSLIISPGSMRRATIWQWVVVVDPSFVVKRTKYERWQRIPDPMTVARAIKAAAEARAPTGNPTAEQLRRRAMTERLRERIAKALGWTVEDTRSYSFYTLREIIRPVSPKLTHELDVMIRSGEYIIDDEHLPRNGNPSARWRGDCAGASYDASIRMRKVGRVPLFMYARLLEALRAQPEIACVTSKVEDRRIELGMKLKPAHEKHGLVAIQRALARATTAVSRDLEVTDLGHVSSLDIGTGWIVVGDDGKPIPFRTYVNDALDGVDGNDTRRVLELMHAQGFPMVSPALISMGSCDGKTGVVAVHSSRKEWKTAKRTVVNPMATAQEMVDAIHAWLVKEEMSYGVLFRSPEQWRKLEWDKEWGLPDVLRPGFIIIAEGTSFNHALAGWMDQDRREEKKIVDSFTKLLEERGWAWSPITGWAFHIYPRQAEMRSPPMPTPVPVPTPASQRPAVVEVRDRSQRPRRSKREQNVGARR